MRIKAYLKNLFYNKIVNSHIIPIKLCTILLNIAHHNIQGRMKAGCFLGYGKGKLALGQRSSINYNCFLDLGNDIIIDNDCEIAYQVTFINSTHEIGNAGHRAGHSISGPIHIKKGCWIGANSIIMPGIVINEGCIIGAGSIVTKNCEANGIYIGQPAIRIKDLN